MIRTELKASAATFKERGTTEACMRAPAVPDYCVITLSVADVSKTYEQVLTVSSLTFDRLNTLP